MKATHSIFSILSLALAITAAQASECEEGTTSIRFSGEIDNNAVKVEFPAIPPCEPGQPPIGCGSYTLGIADLKLTNMEDTRDEIKLTCALLGEPTGNFFPPDHAFEHMIVCHDSQQSELAFQTSFVNLGIAPDYDSLFGVNPVLTEDEIDDFCGNGTAVTRFEELAVVNADRRSKGLFEGASGSLTVKGCVNIVDADNSGLIQEINMGVSGELCLPN